MSTEFSLSNYQQVVGNYILGAIFLTKTVSYIFNKQEKLLAEAHSDKLRLEHMYLLKKR